jgi:hypothetical protein
MTEITMKNQSSQPHWWWLDENTTVRRSTWLQSTLTGMVSTFLFIFYNKILTLYIQDKYTGMKDER